MSILAVDDDTTLGFLLKRAFAKEAVEFRLAVNATEAQAMIEARLPRVVLLDMNLPDASGLEVLTWIRQRSRVPVLMHSSSVRAEELAAVRAAGANAFVEKQSSFDKLRGLVRCLQDYWVLQNRF